MSKSSSLTPRKGNLVTRLRNDSGGTGAGKPVAIAHIVNEGGGGTDRNGTPYIQGVQVSEKRFVTFDMEATNAGGRSSVRQKDNAIYDLSRRWIAFRASISGCA